ncbi:MAG: hypothetical protein CEE42_02010 [Promethearchaeota archaeon Loki_b31]|nr:MAG: hypothetical protein CEE42_02010 [Candidatus Lokiarchaeota archaeon Loki_b31]
MARKKDKKTRAAPRTSTGWAAEEAAEEKIAEGLKRSDLDDGKVTLIDRDLSTPVIETYDADTGELEGSILLKDGNREGLPGLVKIIENVDVELDHDANIESMNFKGKLSVENQSKKDRIWDIDLTLKNIESTTLKSNEIKIRELGTDKNTNTYEEDFVIKGEIKNLLLVKEYVNTLPEADNVLNIRDIESDLLKVKGKTSKAGTKVKERSTTVEEEEVEEEDEEEDSMEDGGTAADDFSLQAFGISIDKENTVTFAIAMRSLFEKPIKNIRVTKNIPGDFSNPVIKDTSVGRADVEGKKIVWNIEKLMPETTVLLKFTCGILVTDITKRKTGTLEVTYEASSSFAEGLDIDKYDAYTRNKFYVDTLERDEEPGMWDCKLVFENPSEFVIQLFNADVYSPDDESTKYVDIDPNDVPLLPAGAQWHSRKWTYESEEYPAFRKKLEFRVMPDFQTIVNGTIAISDVILEIASITGDMEYDIDQVPTYKEKDVIAMLKMVNNGSAPLNEITVVQQYFNKEFQPPKADEIKIIWDGSEIELDSNAVSFDGSVFKITLKDLRHSDNGLFAPESSLEFQYPIHCINPVQDAKFESEIIYFTNTFPISQELEFRPEVPVIEALHLRRRFRIGKEVVPIGALGNYKIILTVENIGTAPLQKLVLMDKVPDSFEYGTYSMKPEITDEVGQDTLKWTIDKLLAEEKIEITYEISGTGAYSPSDAQLGL